MYGKCMIKQYMDSSPMVSNPLCYPNLSAPPPTIWNVNTLLKNSDILSSKLPWSSKLETIAETKIRNSQEKMTHSKIPLAHSNSQYPKNETNSMKIQGSKHPTIINMDYLDSPTKRKKNEVLEKYKAAVVIQRAYRKYLFKKRRLKKKHQNSPLFQCQGLNNSKISKDIGRFMPSSDKSDSIIESRRSAIFKDYLKEGSLFFPERESVVVFGGIDPHSKYGEGRNTGRNIFRYNSELNQWDLVGELPQPRHHHAVAFLKGKIYLAGGTDPRDDEQGKTIVVGTVWSFDPVTRSWFKETDMLTPRKNFGLSVMNGKLLAIGGQDKDGKILSSVEKYDPLNGHWEYIAKLNIERTGVAAARYNDTVWVAGGMTSSKKTPLTASVENYDPKLNKWIEQSRLRFPRCFGCLFAMNDTLYFIGGAGRASEKERTTSSCNAIDLWNPKEEEWKLHFAMSIPRHGHAVAYLGTQILIIGGVTTAYLRALTDVECFCCERKTWVRGVTGLPVPLSGHGAVTLPPASLM